MWLDAGFLATCFRFAGLCCWFITVLVSSSVICIACFQLGCILFAGSFQLVSIKRFLIIEKKNNSIFWYLTLPKHLTLNTIQDLINDPNLVLNF